MIDEIVRDLEAKYVERDMIIAVKNTNLSVRFANSA